MRDWVGALAPVCGLDADLVRAVIRSVYGFDAAARSDKNAIGLMQLLSAAAQKFGAKDLFDPMQNIHPGMTYVSRLLDIYDQDLMLALAAYNAGEAAVERYGGIPPDEETRSYVEKVLFRYGIATEDRASTTISARGKL